MAVGGTQVNESTCRTSTGGKILAIYAALLLLGAIALPWWRMDCRAPQYGARVLSVEVTPLAIQGDTREIDILGHYVGMRPVGSFAPIERALAPYGLLAVVLVAGALPFLPPGRMRKTAAVIIIAVPIGFAIDLMAWQRYAATHLDPNVSLNMIQNRVQTKLVGAYSVAQFSVRATFQEGFWFAIIAALNVLGFLFVEKRARSTSGKLSSVVAAFSVVALLSFGSPADAAILEVGSASAYRTIGSAVAAARPGDEILVHPGTYREHVTIDRPLVLRGEPGAIVDGGGGDTVLLVKSGPTEISGFTIQGSGTSLVSEDAGIKVFEAHGCTVTGNRVNDVLFGILVLSSSKARISKNHVVGKDMEVPRRGDGIRLYNSNDCSVEGNTVERSRDLSVWQSNRVSVRENTVRTSRYGLHYMYCDDNIFENNVFEDNQVGGAIMYSRRLTLRHNRFVGSRGVGAVGLLIKVGDDVEAEKNWIVNNTRGIFIEDAPQALTAKCVIRQNVVGGNDVGISLQPSVNRAMFSENAFIANRVQVEILGGVIKPAKMWSWNGRGNYWSEYVGFDADKDGVGDTPFKIEQFFEDLAGRWPEIGLLRMGPAVEAMEMASRAFPIGKPRVIAIDDHPLIKPPAILEKPVAGVIRFDLVAAGFLLAVGLSFVVRWCCRPLSVGGTR